MHAFSVFNFLFLFFKKVDLPLFAEDTIKLVPSRCLHSWPPGGDVAVSNNKA